MKTAFNEDEQKLIKQAIKYRLQRRRDLSMPRRTGHVENGKVTKQTSSYFTVILYDFGNAGVSTDISSGSASGLTMLTKI